jgi:sugar/nucleoside kinase (ribokinase family)
MTDSPRILVLGDALLDVVARPALPLVSGGDVPAAIGMGPGGQGANVAVRLARRGMTVSLACALGRDPAGALVRAALEGDGVELHPVIEEATGAVVVLVDPGGERTMLSHRVPFARAAAAHAWLTAADWTVISGYLLAEPDAPSLAAALAARPGERVVLGCSIAAGAARAWEAAVGRCRPGLLILNAAEAASLLGTGGDAATLARGLAARLGSRVVVTVPDGAVAAEAEGAAGAMSSRRAGEPASDTTGAGDALAAGIVATLAAGGTLRAALAAGVALGELVARAPGAQARVAGEPEATLAS